MRVLFYVKGTTDAVLSESIADEIQRRHPSATFAAVAFREALEGRRLRESQRFVDVVSESELHEGNGPAPPPSGDGPPAYWRTAMYDRFLSMHRHGFVFRPGTSYGREEIRAVLHRKDAGIRKALADFAPDLVLYASIDMGPVSALLLAKAAADAGVPMRRPVLTRLGDLVFLACTDRDESDPIARRFAELRAPRGSSDSTRRDDARDYLARFRAGRLPIFSPLKPDRAPRALIAGFARAALRDLRRDPLAATLVGRVVDRVQLRARALIAPSLFERPVDSPPFVFFPMHLEPEMALLANAPFWTDQLSLIYNVAQSLPEDTELWVKEHPAALGRRPLGDYRKIAAIPNVRLVDSRMPSGELIRSARGVVTISGTAAFEAFLLGKPAITFGDEDHISDTLHDTLGISDAQTFLPGCLGSRKRVGGRSLGAILSSQWLAAQRKFLSLHYHFLFEHGFQHLQPRSDRELEQLTARIDERRSRRFNFQQLSGHPLMAGGLRFQTLHPVIQPFQELQKPERHHSLHSRSLVVALRKRARAFVGFTVADQYGAICKDADRNAPLRGQIHVPRPSAQNVEPSFIDLSH